MEGVAPVGDPWAVGDGVPVSSYDARGNGTELAEGPATTPFVPTATTTSTWDVGRGTWGELVGVELPNGHTVTYRYDVAGHLVVRRQEGGSPTVVTQDRFVVDSALLPQARVWYDDQPSVRALPGCQVRAELQELLVARDQRGPATLRRCEGHAVQGVAVLPRSLHGSSAVSTRRTTSAGISRTFPVISQIHAWVSSTTLRATLFLRPGPEDGARVPQLRGDAQPVPCLDVGGERRRCRLAGAQR